MQINVETVTPARAEQFLAKNVNNRPIRPRMVAAYARDLLSGRWQETGDAIKFAEDGTLLDGQHRLTAVVRTGVPVRLLIVRGLPRESQRVMDTGLKRQAADQVHIEGAAHGSVVASVARVALTIAHGSDMAGARAITNAEVMEWIDNNPDVHPAAAAANTLKGRASDFPPSVIAYTWMIFSRISPGECVEFWQSVADNATDGRGDPRNALIGRFAAKRRQRERISTTTMVGMVIRSWNAWRGGEHVAILKTSAAVYKAL